MPFKQPHPLYSIWQGMKRRCYNPNNQQFHNYGGRGIRVCDRWLNSFQNFLNDMPPRPDGFSIDRIDNDGNYSPENCRWADQKTQMRNQTITRKVVVEGKEYLAVELAEIVGMKTDSIVERAKNGLSLAEILDKKRRVFKEGLALGGKANGVRQRAKTHCPQGHKYSVENIEPNKHGWRRCRRCHRERAALRRQSLR